MEVKRATFEEVNKAQLELIFDILEELIEKKETVDKKSRKVFFDLFAFALLGKGLEYDFIFHYRGNKYNLGSLSAIARQMVFHTDKNPVIQLKSTKEKVPIELLWISLRDNLYKPMDEALTLGLRSSAEIFNSGGGSHRIDVDKEGKGVNKKQTRD